MPPMRTGSPRPSSGSSSAARPAPGGNVALDEPTPAWESPTTVAVVSALLLVATLAADLAISSQVAVLTIFLGIPPLVASAALGPRPTAVFAVTATALAALSGVWNGVSAQYWIRLIDVGVVSGLAVVVSATRVQREDDLRTSRRIASVAQQA